MTVAVFEIWLSINNQVEADGRRIGTSKKVDVGICGDVKLAAREMIDAIKGNDGPIASDENKAERLEKFATVSTL